MSKELVRKLSAAKAVLERYGYKDDAAAVGEASAEVERIPDLEKQIADLKAKAPK